MFNGQSLVMNKALFLLAILLPFISQAQLTQIIKGSVHDKESHTPLQGVAVSVTDVEGKPGTVTDEAGNFSIGNIPVGKHSMRLSYLGYQSVELSDILVTSAREVVVVVEMEETTNKIAEVEIKAKREHINEMAIVSAKTFEVQETERYAGSRADPARMASCRRLLRPG